jgi:hypothetical protein
MRHDSTAIASGVDEMPLPNFRGVGVGFIFKLMFGSICRQP